AMLFLAGAIAVILLGLGRNNASWHWAMVVIGGSFSGELLILLTGLMMERPEVMPSLGEVPFRPYLLACLVFGFFAVLLAKDLGA
ncbi:hypothetical protein Q6245_28980, partial [Klebsiella pneumoniae]|uniref:hypothetical protein n=1 Tax=Klebsiella pneumoniae TaxID=573 RepID=UPI00273106F3